MGTGGWEMVAAGLNAVNTTKKRPAMRTARACNDRWDMLKKLEPPSGDPVDTPWGQGQAALLAATAEAVRLAAMEHDLGSGQVDYSSDEYVPVAPPELTLSEAEAESLAEIRAADAPAAAAAAAATPGAEGPSAAVRSGGKDNSAKRRMLKLDNTSLTSSSMAASVSR